MPSPKLYFRCALDLLARFTAKCDAQGLSPSQGLRAAVEAWVALEHPRHPAPPAAVTQLPLPLPEPTDADLEMLLAEFEAQGVLH